MTHGSFGEERPSPTPYAPRKENKRKTGGASRNRSYRITPEEFIRTTSPKDREVLRKTLNESILFYLECEKAVYLDGFGIIYPEQKQGVVTYPLSETHAMIRQETTLRARFEKCYDLVSYHREAYPTIVETNEIAKRIYPRLPLSNQATWSEWDTARNLRGLIRSIRDEVIIDGFSKQLGSIGEFFSLHNRQGDSPDSWFAGADIYLKSNHTIPLTVEDGRTYALPELADSWELPTAAYGPPIHTLDVSLFNELAALGYADHSAETLGNETLQVGVFVSSSSESGERKLIYCTQGAYEPASSTPENPGHEFVFQIPFRGEDNQISPEEIPLWPTRALVMGWLLLQSSKSKVLAYGAGISCDSPINEDNNSSQNVNNGKGSTDCILTGIFATPFELSKNPQRVKGGSLRYINLIGITEDEGKVAELYGSDHLHLLLQFKNYDQVTNPSRKSIIAKTGLLPQ